MAASGAIGQFAFGWFASGGTGGSGPGASGFQMLGVVCGQPGGPVAGQTTYQNDALINADTVILAVVNAVNEVALGAAPAFTFDAPAGEIDRGPNVWVDGDTLIIFYKPAA